MQLSVFLLHLIFVPSCCLTELMSNGMALSVVALSVLGAFGTLVSARPSSLPVTKPKSFAEVPVVDSPSLTSGPTLLSATLLKVQDSFPAALDLHGYNPRTELNLPCTDCTTFDHSA